MTTRRTPATASSRRTTTTTRAAARRSGIRASDGRRGSSPPARRPHDHSLGDTEAFRCQPRCSCCRSPAGSAGPPPPRSPTPRGSSSSRQDPPRARRAVHKCHSAATKAGKSKGGLAPRHPGGHAQGRRHRARPSCPASPRRACCSKAIRHDGDAKMPPEGQAARRGRRRLRGVGRDGRHPTRGTAAPPPATSTGRRPRSSGRSSPPAGRRRPPSRTPPGPTTDIDRFVLAELGRAGAEARRAGRQADAHPPGDLRPDRPAADARRRSRRSSRTTPPDAFAQVVDRLLASPHYGERWARHWLDVARYAEDQAPHLRRQAEDPAPTATATGSSRPSTPTCPTTASSGCRSPAT